MINKTYIEIKYTKTLTKCFESKCKQDKTRKVPNIRQSIEIIYSYCSSINGTLMIPAINNQHAIQSNSMTIIDFFISC